MRLTHDIYARDLLRRFNDRITGAAYIDNITGLDKQDIMVGMLGAQRIKEKFGEKEEYIIDLEKQYENLPAISLTYLTKKNHDGVFVMNFSGDFYYRIPPTFEMQVNEYLTVFNSKNGTSFTDVKEAEEYRVKNELADERLLFMDVYNKMNFNNSKSLVKLEKNTFTDGLFLEIENDLNSILLEEISKIKDKSFQFIRGNKNYTPNDLIDEETYKQLITGSTCQITPNWKLKVLVRVRSFDEDTWQVDITFFNNTPALDSIKHAYDENFYNAKIQIKGIDGAKFENIQTGYLKKTYKNQPITKALSSNAAVIFDENENTIETNCLPNFEQKRILTNDKYNQNISFDALISNSSINLRKILADMNKDYEAIVRNFNIIKQSGKMSQANQKQFADDLDNYRIEIDRFELGIRCIENIHYVAKAFKYMNMTMKTQMFDGQKTYPGWRLFQIVFVVSLIPDVIKQEYKDDPSLDRVDLKLVDLLYFSTGGGKTEAFFGITSFTMFFDRLRGKKIGVSSIIKYPLRLLSVQQLDRCLSMIAKANKVLFENECNMEPFEVGYLVGEGNTPNRVTEEIYSEINSSSQEDLDDKYRVVDACPYCGSTHISISFNKDRWVIEHNCKNCGKTLPLYTVDDEIFRFLPSVVISTIDKLAAIGNQRKYKSLFGGVTHHCYKHGYSIDNVCNVSDLKLNCNLDNIEDELYDPIPTLVIQDELHLVRESLGTFSSHYETLLQTYCEELVNKEFRKKIKYIGATATISSYNEHISQLYGLNSRRFPCEYPSKQTGINFYSYESKEQISRIIQGLTPYGISVTDSIQVLNTIFRKVLNAIFNNTNEELHYWKNLGYELSENDLIKMNMDYWISIVYNNSKRESQDLENLFVNQGNNTLGNLGIPEYIIAKISGDEDFKDIKEVLSNIVSDKDKRNTKNLILATSSISHGVDEDSFNQMYFFGLPNNTAEYIQAYSRVGRKYTGIVIDVFRLVRERDRSYLKYFDLFHENKDLTIEPVPIDRWAKNAVYHTLPGIFNAIVLQYYEILHGCKYNSQKPFIELMKSIDNNEIIDIIKKCYKCDESNMKSKFYSEIIEQEVKTMIDGIGSFSGKPRYTSELIKAFSSHKLGPMNSLRDYEDGIEVEAE